MAGKSDHYFMENAASTYNEFLDLLRAKGYETKGETVGENAAKYIAFRSLGHERFARGSVKILGKCAL